MRFFVNNPWLFVNKARLFLNKSYLFSEKWLLLTDKRSDFQKSIVCHPCVSVCHPSKRCTPFIYWGCISVSPFFLKM